MALRVSRLAGAVLALIVLLVAADPTPRFLGIGDGDDGRAAETDGVLRRAKNVKFVMPPSVAPSSDSSPPTSHAAVASPSSPDGEPPPVAWTAVARLGGTSSSFRDSVASFRLRC